MLGPVRHGITREIWGDGDTILLIFAGAAAEFALNRAVDWLFFTGALPADPLPRLFRTVQYAQSIAFASPCDATRTLERIRQVHASVERQRSQSIPPWAHRAVLYMLIDYSERAAHLLRGPLSPGRQESLYADFRRIGLGLGVTELPLTYAEWKIDRARRLTEDLAWSPLSARLYDAYRHHLGPVRYELLRHIQAVLVPTHVRSTLRLPVTATAPVLIAAWRAVRALRLGLVARHLVVPPQHWSDLSRLEHRHSLTAPAA
ncbi:MAG TPA: oxygenase MpaB family protein [Gemmatimonadales bacterium]|nr:oxygenase MpaB family protein [Gemmatimonadales bacterium]